MENDARCNPKCDSYRISSFKTFHGTCHVLYSVMVTQQGMRVHTAADGRSERASHIAAEGARVPHWCSTKYICAQGRNHRVAALRFEGFLKPHDVLGHRCKVALVALIIGYCIACGGTRGKHLESFIL